MRFLVVYNGPEDPNGGSSGTVWQTNEALKRLGHDVHAIYEDEIRRVVRHHNLHYAVELPHRILQVAKERLHKNHYDVVLISQPYGYFVGKWLRKRNSNTIYLHRSHGHELAASHQISSWEDGLGARRSFRRRLASRVLALRLTQQARLALKYADGTVVPSTFDRDFLIEHEGLDSKKVRCIFHASLPVYLESEPKPYNEERHSRLLYVGNFSQRKGGDILWKAGTALLRRYPKLTLTIVAGRTDHARALAGFGADVAERIHLMEWVSQNELMNIYDQHGLQIVPSRYEGAGKAHYEGMSRGLCVVCSSAGAMSDSITSGENGWLVSPCDADGFVDALSHVIDRYDIACRVAKKARERSFDFTWDRTASEVVNYAAELLFERGRFSEQPTRQAYAGNRE